MLILPKIKSIPDVKYNPKQIVSGEGNRNKYFSNLYMKNYYESLEKENL